VRGAELITAGLVSAWPDVLPLECFALLFDWCVLVLARLSAHSTCHRFSSYQLGLWLRHKQKTVNRRQYVSSKFCFRCLGIPPAVCWQVLYWRCVCHDRDSFPAMYICSHNSTFPHFDGSNLVGPSSHAAGEPQLSVQASFRQAFLKGAMCMQDMVSHFGLSGV
jgi:hypothetical protein